MTLNSNFWFPTAITPVPALAHLRAMVLARSEKRSPKWKFRLASNLVVQIQPKLTTSLLRFECLALQCCGANLELLATPLNKMEADYCRIHFELRADVPDEWRFKPTSCQRKRGTDGAVYWQLRDHLVSAFNTRFDQLRPELMLGSQCLICGKGLTDPVSMARFIGPECAGTAAEGLPFILTPSHEFENKQSAS